MALICGRDALDRLNLGTFPGQRNGRSPIRDRGRYKPLAEGPKMLNVERERASQLRD